MTASSPIRKLVDLSIERQSGNELVLSYLSLRKLVGMIGFMLPFVLAFGKVLFQGSGILPSISAYYYTDMRNVFVGSLCAIGLFLMSCRGYDQKDEIAGHLGCTFAIGVALFPTTPSSNATSFGKIIGAFHLSFAALLFLTFAFFCLKLFTKTVGNPSPRKLQRNMVYRACGRTILICIFLIVIVHLPWIARLGEKFAPVFWLESIAVISFGVAWLTKGEAILKDESEPVIESRFSAGAR